MSEAGIRHITFRVDDVDAIYERLRAAGVEFTIPPRQAVNAELIRKVAFCRDPDGIVVEFLERQPSA
jgi:glyoxylase I family protein